MAAANGKDIQQISDLTPITEEILMLFVHQRLTPKNDPEILADSQQGAIASSYCRKCRGVRVRRSAQPETGNY